MFDQTGNEERQGEADDVRVFRGAHVNADFEDGIDLLNLRAYPGANLGNTTIAAQGIDTLVTFVGGESVLVLGIDPSNITGADIHFA